ncbi:MAG: ABC transporter ATP-binding protein [Ignavibacteriales bacterium]
MADEKFGGRPPARTRAFAGGPPGHLAGLMGAKVRAKDSKKTLRRLWEYLNRQKVMLIFVFILVFISTILSLIGPLLIGYAVDAMVNGKGQVDFARLITIVLSLLLIYILSALMSWFQTYYMIGVAQDTLWELRKDLFGKVQTLSLKFFDSRPHGELMSRLTNDVENINTTLTQSVTQVFSSLITVLGVIGMMLYLSPLLTLLSLISIPIGMFAASKIAGYTRKFFSTQQKELGELNGYIEETMSGQKVVKAFVREEKVLEEFSQTNERLKKAGIKAQVFSGIIMPIMNAINNLSFAIVAGAGGLMAVKGMITIGVIASFLSYSKQLTRPINEIANQFNMIQSALAGAERVFEIMDERPEFEDNLGASEFEGVVGSVIFKDVDFSYDKEVPVLKNVSINAEPGQTIALVGPTGAGKTTIVNLLTRFYDIDKGNIFIDGKDIRDIQKDSLRKSLGIVLQDTYLFSETVRENIRYGRLDASDAEVEAAARLANAEHFILRLHDGYDTILSEDGGNLSQGQRQLLAIARTILANPSILILDEATSSVDTRTELHIQEAMLSLMQGRTSFVIAHRLSTIRDANKIMVINGGEIIERGTHKQLLEGKGFYYNLYMSQFKRQASQA